MSCRCALVKASKCTLCSRNFKPAIAYKQKSHRFAAALYKNLSIELDLLHVEFTVSDCVISTSVANATRKGTIHIASCHFGNCNYAGITSAGIGVLIERIGARPEA